MGKNRKNKSLLIPILQSITVLLCILVSWMGFTVWSDSQRVFQDVTVELGTQSLSIVDFLTPLGDPSRASFVTDPATIDLSRVGRSSLTLKHGSQKAVVNVIVEDTTPPEAAFLPEYSVCVTDPMPQASALVTRIRDASQVRVYYGTPPVIPAGYSDVTAVVMVEDTSGNVVEGRCLLHFTGWLKESVTVELGSSLTPDMVLTNPEKDASLLRQEALSQVVSSLGPHTLTVQTGSCTAECAVNVVDTTAPVLVLRSVRRFPGEAVTAEDFVVTAEDLSGPPKVSAVGELPDPWEEGAHTVTIRADDASGNVSSRETMLWISDNCTPPEILGASEPLTVRKGTDPDLLSGVTAADDEDGTCDVTVDTSELDLSQPGTYLITYIATDSVGNMGACQRKVIVK